MLFISIEHIPYKVWYHIRDSETGSCIYNSENKCYKENACTWDDWIKRFKIKMKLGMELMEHNK